VNEATIAFYGGLSLIIIAFCASFMVLSKKVKDGILLKIWLAGLAVVSLLGVLARLKGVDDKELNLLTFVGVAGVAVAAVLRVANNTSALIDKEWR
jgi:hypothetical protein